ncbi:MAG: hypothetical protein ABEJ85_04645 [Haloarculaceae archaeon]
MPANPVPGERGPSVDVGVPRPADAAPADVCPSVVEPRSDGTDRYIIYPAEVDGSSVSECWLSVDLEVVVARELWR